MRLKILQGNKVIVTDLLGSKKEAILKVMKNDFWDSSFLRLCAIRVFDFKGL